MIVHYNNAVMFQEDVPSYNLQTLMEQASKNKQRSPLLNLSSSEIKSPAFTPEQRSEQRNVKPVLERLEDCLSSESDDEEEAPAAAAAATTTSGKEQQGLRMTIPKQNSPATTMQASTTASKGRKPAINKPLPKPRGRPPKRADNQSVIATKPATKAATKPLTKAATKPATKAATKPAKKPTKKPAKKPAPKTAKTPATKAGKKKVISSEFINEGSDSSSSNSSYSSDSSDEDNEPSKMLQDKKQQEIPPPAAAPKRMQDRIEDVFNEVIPQPLSPLCSKSTKKSISSKSKGRARGEQSNTPVTSSLPKGVELKNGRPCIIVSFTRPLYDFISGLANTTNKKTDRKESGEVTDSERSSADDQLHLQYRTEHNRTNTSDIVRKKPNKRKVDDVCLRSTVVVHDVHAGMPVSLDPSTTCKVVAATAAAAIARLPPPPPAAAPAAAAKQTKRPESLADLGIVAQTSLPKSLKIPHRKRPAAGTPSSIDSPMDEVKRSRHDHTSSKRTPSRHTPSRGTPDHRGAAASLARDRYVIYIACIFQSNLSFQLFLLL